MEIIKIHLKESDTIKDILAVFDEEIFQKIILLCPRNLLLFSEISNLKKLKTKAQEKNKKFALIIPQKFIRDIAISQEIEVYSTLPKEFIETPEKNLEDINHPKKKARKIEKEKTETNKKNISKKLPEFSTQKIGETKQEKLLRGKVFFGLLTAIGLLSLILFWISPKATIIIKPKISVIPVTQNILIQMPESTIRPEDEELPKIKGIEIETEIAETQIFPTGGRKYDLTNAKGRVTLFNETTKEKFLVPSRLANREGAIFRFSNNVTIPPASSTEPGKAEVIITADEYDSKGEPIGERGNIQAGTELYFPALRSELQELYYAKANKGPLVGGSTLTHYFMIEEDIPTAKRRLFENFESRGIEKLRQEVQQRSSREKKQYVLLEDRRIFKSEILEESYPTEQVGQPTQTFEAFGKMKMKGLVFDQSQVIQFLNQKIQETQDHRKKLITIDPHSAQYKILETSEDNEKTSNWVKLSVQMKGIEMFDFNAESNTAREWRQTLKKEIAGKTKQEAMGLLTNFSEIENIADIKIDPPWSKKIPTLFDQIEFKIQNDTTSE